MSGKTFAYASSWTHGDGDVGLYLYRFDDLTGELSLVKRLDETTNFGVSFADPDRGLLYILDECIDFPGLRGGGGGRLFAYRINPESGELQEISCVPTLCPNPSYVSMDPDKRYLVVSHHAGKSCITKLVKDPNGKYYSLVEYDDSTVELFALNEDGSVGDLLDAVKHSGSGPDPRHQNNPHPHCAVMSPSGKLFTVCDKGNDGIYMYRIDAERNKLVLAGFAQCVPGCKPRFCAYHPNLPYLYQNNEGLAEVFIWRYEENGRLELAGRCSALFPETTAMNGTGIQQDLRIDSKGEYLYSVVRDPGCIAVYHIDQTSGELELIQNQMVDGLWPRGCALSPDGRFLVVTAMKSGHVLVYSVGEDGCLAPTGSRVEQPFASFISFYQPKG